MLVNSTDYTISKENRDRRTVSGEHLFFTKLLTLSDVQTVLVYASLFLGGNIRDFLRDNPLLLFAISPSV